MINEVRLVGTVTKIVHSETNGHSPVCNITLLTSRIWTTNSGEKKLDKEYHDVVAYDNHAVLCRNFETDMILSVQGRLKTVAFSKGGNVHQRTKVIVTKINPYEG